MRSWKLVVLAGAVVLAGVGAFVAWPRRQRITRENFDRITGGMNRAEVEVILGPPGDHMTRPWSLDHLRTVTLGQSEEYAESREWVGDGGVIHLRFDATGRPCKKQFCRWAERRSASG